MKLGWEATGSGVMCEGSPYMYFASICGTNLYREDDRCSMGIEGIGGELSGESLFPFGPPRQGCPDRRRGGECVRGRFST